MTADLAIEITHRRAARRSADLPHAAWLFLPALIPVAYIALFASPAPVTDDWAMLKAAIAIRDMGWLQAAQTIMDLKMNDHHAAVPMLIYLPLSYATHFDARAMMLVTVANYAVQLIIYRRAVGGSLVAMIPIAFLLFVPSHWMEFQWGNCFTISLSITFSMLALLVIDAIDAKNTSKAVAVGACVALILLGMMSSAGAWFGFPGAMVALVQTRLTVRAKAVAAIFLVVAAALSYWLLMDHESALHAPSIRDAIYLMSALGSMIWSSPAAIMDVQFDYRAATGLLILALPAMATVEAIRVGRSRELALPVALLVFGCGSLMAIALSRPYLGNWHLQYGIPAAVGSYACCWVALRDRWPQIRLALSAVALSWLAVGGFQAFAVYGPGYLRYVHQIEAYMLHFDPNAAKPFAVTGGWDFDGTMANFLSQQGNLMSAISSSSAGRATQSSTKPDELYRNDVVSFQIGMMTPDEAGKFLRQTAELRAANPQNWESFEAIATQMIRDAYKAGKDQELK
jgi:hypothetical protein